MEKNAVIEQPREQDRGLDLKDDRNHGNPGKEAEMSVPESEELLTISAFSL